MNSKKIWLCFLTALLLSAGCSRSKSKAGFAVWMDGHKTELSARGEDCAGNTFPYTYVPRAWVACEGGLSPEETPGEWVQLDLRLATPPTDASAMNGRLVQYADLAMKDDLHLLYGTEKRTCGVVQIESNFTVPGRYRFILIFEGIWTTDAPDSIRIVYDGAVFGCSGKPVEASFQNLVISDIPEIDCKP